VTEEVLSGDRTTIVKVLFPTIIGELARASEELTTLFMRTTEFDAVDNKEAVIFIVVITFGAVEE
jgi:hypothetical protein